MLPTPNNIARLARAELALEQASQLLADARGALSECGCETNQTDALTAMSNLARILAEGARSDIDGLCGVVTVHRGPPPELAEILSRS